MPSNSIKYNTKDSNIPSTFGSECLLPFSDFRLTEPESSVTMPYIHYYAVQGGSARDIALQHCTVRRPFCHDDAQRPSWSRGRL